MKKISFLRGKYKLHSNYAIYINIAGNNHHNIKFIQHTNHKNIKFTITLPATITKSQNVSNIADYNP